MRYDFITARQWKRMPTQKILESIAIAIRILEVTKDDYNSEMLKRIIKNETSILTLL